MSVVGTIPGRTGRARVPTRAEQRAIEVRSRLASPGGFGAPQGVEFPEVKGFSPGKLVVIEGPWGAGKTYVLTAGYLLPVLRAGGQVASNYSLHPVGKYADHGGSHVLLSHPWQMAELRNTAIGIDEIIQWWPSSDGHILGTLERFLFAQARHLGLSIYGTTQHLDRINSGLKDRVHERVECKGRGWFKAMKGITYPHGYAKKEATKKRWRWDQEAADSYDTNEIIVPVEGPDAEIAVCAEIAYRHRTGKSARGLLRDVLGPGAPAPALPGAIAKPSQQDTR